MTGRKKLLVVGDRVLISPEKGEERTEVGLILPQTAVEKKAVQGGRVVSVGPGTPVGSPSDGDNEPWKESPREPRYIPMQAEEGDFALFLKAVAVEIQFEGKHYLIVPQSAILVLIRDEDVVDTLLPPNPPAE